MSAVAATSRALTTRGRAWAALVPVVLLVGACTGGTGPAGAESTAAAPSATSVPSDTSVPSATSASTSTAGVPTPATSPTTTTAVPRPSATAPSAGTDPARATVTKLLVVVVENHSLAQMRDGMPYTYALARRYGYADHYTATRHPSLPNYLAIVSGGTQGVGDDAGPSAHPLAGPTVFGAALARGRTAALYADAMTSPCQTGSSGRYAVKHNPWAYFVDERAACRRHDLPVAAFDTAARGGTLPAAGMLVPDLCNDAHDCTLATADAWFRARMTTVMSGPDWRSGRLVVVLTADEDDRTAGNRVLTVVAHPSLHGIAVHTALTHYSLTRLYAEVTGAPALGHARDATSMATAFGLRTQRP